MFVKLLNNNFKVKMRFCDISLISLESYLKVRVHITSFCSSAHHTVNSSVAHPTPVKILIIIFLPLNLDFNTLPPNQKVASQVALTTGVLTCDTMLDPLCFNKFKECSGSSRGRFCHPLFPSKKMSSKKLESLKFSNGFDLT